MNTDKEKDLARAQSLSEEMMSQIAPGVMSVFNAAVEAKEPPHVVLGAMEMTIAQMIRQMSCGFAAAGHEAGMAVSIMKSVGMYSLNTDWPTFRQSFDERAAELSGATTPPARVAQ